MYLLTIGSNLQDSETMQILLHANISWGWEESSQHTFLVHFTGKDRAVEFMDLVRDTLPDSLFELAPVQNMDWSQDWKKYFTPVAVEDTFIILPEWHADTESSLTKIIITPKMAFGTGHHPTTSLCLKSLASVFKQGALDSKSTFLDLGTGSGILGIAAAKLGMTGLGLDNDPCAVDNASENIALNNVGSRFQVKAGEVAATGNKDRFNLILANILSSTLINLAEELCSKLDKHRACLILSGILDKQVQKVISAYKGLAPGTPYVQSQDEWSAITWIKEH